MAAACLPVLVSPLQAVELYTSDTGEPEPRRPEIVVTYGETSIEDGGSEALLLEQERREEGGTGGLERLYWENSPDNDWRVYLDSFALLAPDEFGVNLEIHNGWDVFFDLGFYHWNEYEYGSGIWYPPTGFFPVLSADALEKELNKLDLNLRFSPRETIWIELGYSFFNRDGESLSTRFGDDFAYRIGGTPSRGIVPALWDGQETVHTLDAKLVRIDWMDRAGIRFRYQRRTVDRTHVVERAARQPSSNRVVTQKEDSKDDLFAFSGFNRKELGETLYGSLGFAYTRLDGDLTGSRIFGTAPDAAYDIDFAAFQLQDRGFLDLENTRRLSQWIFNANLVYTPSETVKWMTGLRLEHLSTKAFSSYIDTYTRVDWTVRERQQEEALMSARSEKSALDLSAFLEARYSGIAHTLFYSRLEVANQDGDLEEDWSRQEYNPDVRSITELLDRATDFNRTLAYWEVGMHYFPVSRLRISLEGYLKHRENSYDWGGLEQPETDFTEYPGWLAKQVFLTRDVNGRLSWRIHDSLKSITRVDYQITTIDNQDELHDRIEASERTRLLFNQSLTWTPTPRLFLSGTYTLVEDLTESVAAGLQGVFSGIIVDLPNDYWQVSGNLYYVVSQLLDIQLTYQYLEMSNYLNTAPTTVPYGSDLVQHHGSARLIFHINDRTRARLGYDYYEYDEPSAGGNRDYEAHLVSGSFQLVF